MTTALTSIVQALTGAAGTVLVEARGRQLTGGDLLARIGARAADLRQAGLRQGDLAMIVVSDNLAAIEQLVACWTLGAAGCLVDFRMPAARLAEWHGRLKPARVLSLRPMPGMAAHLQPRDPVAAPVPGAAPLPDDPDLLAMVLASSGTTGLPNLHSVPQGRLDLVLDLLASYAADAPTGATLSATSVAYSASGHIWLRNLRMARPTVALDLVHRIEELDRALQRPDVSESALPPALIRRLLALPSDRVPRYPQLRRFTSVGGPARPEDKLAAVTRLSPAYVMTYSCVGIGLIARITGDEVLARPASCGRPAPPVTVTIRDGDRICAPGETGEIVVTTDKVREARPGDLGWLDADGYLFVAGRVQGLLCRNGVNFNAERLIGAAVAVPGVAEAGVVALTDADGGDEVHLVVQAEAGAAAAVQAHLRRTLPPSEQPDRVHASDEIALTPAGKVDQRALIQWLKEQSCAALA